MIKRFEILRVVTALIVLVGHVRSIFWPPLSDFGHANLLVKGLYFATGFGHQAVLVFFVMSGYLVGGRYLTREFSTKTQIRKRVFRIYPVFILALCLSVFLNGEEKSYLEYVVLFFGLGEVIGVELANNPPLWSLSYELVYYVLFAFLLSKKIFNRVVGFVIAFILVFLAPEVVAYSLFWVLGACLRIEGFCVVLKNFRKQALALGGIALLMVRFQRGEMTPVNYVLNVVVVLGCCAYLVDSLSRQSISASLQWFGRLSYPLYAVHYPLLIFCHRNVEGAFGQGLVLVFVVAVLLLIVETKFLRWLEKFYKPG